mgnify:FL=1
MYHFDFYRFKDSSEWTASGFREYFDSQSACLVEWPERAGDLLAVPDLELILAFEGESRRATLSARTEAGEAWLSAGRSRWGSP